MIIGLPKELKQNETRVALLPEAVKSLIQKGHSVLVQKGAGRAGGYPDSLYRKVGAKMVPTLAQIHHRAQLVVKVKEPLPKEYSLFRPGLMLFCYLHLAANPKLARALLKHKVTALGFETLVNSRGQTPLLQPMSDIAGRLSAQLGAQFLRSDTGGKGILLSATPNSAPGQVLIVGAGNVGRAAAEVAAGIGARVVALDRRPGPLKTWAKKHPFIRLKKFTPAALRRNISKADLVIGSVYIPGARTPRLIRRGMVKAMSPGSVLVDVAVDQGGAAETTRPTTIAKPIYRKYGIIHCAIANLPALTGRSASQALSRVIWPYVHRVAGRGTGERILKDALLNSAVNIHEGRIIHPVVREALKKEAER